MLTYAEVNSTSFSQDYIRLTEILTKLQSLVMAALGFTPASGQDVFSIDTGEQSSSTTGCVLSGKEARHFYENLMKDDKAHRKDDGRGHSRRVRRRGRAAEMHRGQTSSGSNESEGSQRRETSESSMQLLGLRLLRCAHEGDVSSLKDLLSKGADINFQDTYFWTAVMCASWSGQRAAVRLLLQREAAWVGVVDTQGRDARDLALEAGHSDILEEFESYGESTQRDIPSDNRAAQRQWCDVCCNEYSGGLSSHLSSTLHQFSLQRPPPSPYYCLPPSSNSYKMMVRCGWKPGTGLGPEGEGTKQPVSTVLKRDNEGLGYGQMKRAKVTHFQARDHDAVKLPSKEKEKSGGKGQRKEESRRKEQKDKNWERDFRASFYL
ncbi:G patch domain and ankyrin repeat-containing protein 1 [Larimichthys crocea]|uniref:G patch domain and ankyrin repeat-containing protein 1 n=1 Tax=Larimichthys crocea TaxID=215358 RepID=A0A6G0J9F2_LARCR|nr:G patch domain and ankyrin repeat-containing protein 1 [Larimichthys crocea]